MEIPMRDRLRKREEVLAPIPTATYSSTVCEPKTTAERSKKYYHQLKDKKPDEFLEKLQHQRDRSKQDRDHFKRNATEEEKEMRREKNRLRTKAYRERKKLAEENMERSEKSTEKRFTRHQTEKLEHTKELNKMRKRKERAGWSTQKHSAEKKKSRDRYYAKQFENKKSSAFSSQTEEEIDTERTPAGRYMAVSRLNNALPKDTRKRQQTIDDFFKRNQGKQLIQQTTSTTEKILFSNDGLNSRESRTFKRFLAAKLLHLPKKEHTKVLSKIKSSKRTIEAMAALKASPLRKQNIRNISLKLAVQNFYIDNSRLMPVRRQKPVRVLDSTLKVLFEEFKEQHPWQTKTSFSFFCKHRPKSVRTQSLVKFNQSLCDICENIELKIKAINRACRENVFASRKHLLGTLLCPKEGLYFKRKCLEQRCPECGFHKVAELIKPEHLEEVVEAREWGMTDIQRGEKVVKKKVLLRQEKTVREILDDLAQSLVQFPKHNFFANWQYAQYNSQKNKLKPGELLAVLDFAENYRCSSQDEAQSAHWNYLQATIHPIVFNYKCTCGKDECQSVVIISDDLNHDSAAVQVFTERALSHMKEFGPFHRLIEFTDGCSAQYKSKQPFLDLQTAFEPFGMEIERNFFGSRHGKGPSDGESAVVKSGATRAVKNRKHLIQNANDLYLFGVKEMSKDGQCVHFKRKFIFVHQHEVQQRRRLISTNALKPLKGTRSLHAIKVRNGKLLCRNLTCFCSDCEEGSVGEQCGEHADPWQEHTMLSVPRQKKHQKEHHNPGLEELSTSTLEFLETIDEPNEPRNDDPILETIQTDANTTEQDPNRMSDSNEPRDDPIPETETIQTEDNTTEQQDFNRMPDNNVQKPLNDQNIMPESENTAEQCENLPDKSDKLGKKINPGAWVIASFSGKKKQVYLGLVLEVDGPEAQIKFCRRSGQVFTWPLVDDIGWMPLYSLTAIGVPDVDPRERMRLPLQTMNIFN